MPYVCAAVLVTATNKRFDLFRASGGAAAPVAAAPRWAVRAL